MHEWFVFGWVFENTTVGIDLTIDHHLGYGIISVYSLMAFEYVLLQVFRWGRGAGFSCRPKKKGPVWLPRHPEKSPGTHGQLKTQPGLLL